MISSPAGTLRSAVSAPFFLFVGHGVGQICVKPIWQLLFSAFGEKLHELCSQSYNCSIWQKMNSHFVVFVHLHLSNGVIV